MNRLLKNYLIARAGKNEYQQLFEELHYLALLGMNIGGGESTEYSGEKFVLEHINRQLQKAAKLMVFDVGANVGNYSMLANKILKERASIFAFEPSARTFKKLVRNTENMSNIRHFPFGFGNENTSLALFSNAHESGLASVYKRRLDHFNINMNIKEEIEIKTIDDFCFENAINHIHFLKIDAEGHELKILEGAKQMMTSGNIDFIQFEFGGCNIDSRTYFQDFYYYLNNNFTISRILKDGLFKIIKYKEMYEAFTTTNFLAELKR
jgi:FkbM family methyltransferase